jgi:hypothetical protein
VIQVAPWLTPHDVHVLQDSELPDMAVMPIGESEHGVRVGANSLGEARLVQTAALCKTITCHFVF